MNNAGNSNGQPKITDLFLRLDPNVETHCFVALVRGFSSITKVLGFTRGRIQYHFVSTSLASQRGRKEQNGFLTAQIRQKIERAQGVAHFNVGGQGVRGWDSHGRPDSDRICSLQVALADHNFLEHRPIIEPIVQMVMGNDKEGQGLSYHPLNLKGLVDSLNDLKFREPELVLEWGVLAFFGIFANAQARVNIKEIFDPKNLVGGVRKYLKQRVDKAKITSLEADQKFAWFQKLLYHSIENSKKKWQEAQSLIIQAEENNDVAEVLVPVVDQKVKIILVNSWNYKVPAAGRKKGYGLVIHFQPDGHCQISSSIITTSAGKKVKLHLGKPAAEVRKFEALFRNTRIRKGEIWETIGVVYDENDQVIPWYLAPYRSGLLNGSRSSRDMEPTLIEPKKLLAIVVKTLPKCEAIPAPSRNSEKEGADEKEVVATTEDA